MYGRALQFIFKNKLSYYFVFPLILNIILFLIGFQLVDILSEQTNQLINDFLFSGNDNSGWLMSFFNTIIYWSIWIVSKIIFFFVFSLVGGYFTIIILAPILTYLSEKTAEIITGEKHPFDILQFTRDILRAILVALRNMIIQLGFVVGFFLVSFIPVIGWIISLVGNFIISSYFYGFSFIDYSNERNRLPISKSIKFVRDNKGFSIGLGSIFSFCFLIPFLGGIIASFLCVVSVVAATIGVEEINKEPK